MFDDLRSSDDDQASFFQDDQAEIDPLLAKRAKPSSLNIKFNSRTFLGMNAFQRFVISTLLFMMVCILGAMFLMITGSIMF
ncbi:MAG: hypothetical protein NT121_07185 [Chloroflexi bacterium]|nr:hypothetical protein [Chloroflexota bacterium]